MTGLGNPSLHLIESVDDGQEFLRWLGERRENDAVSVDLETGELPGNDAKDALSPWHGRIRLAQVGDEHTGWAIPWDYWKGVFYQGMSRYEGLIVAHNIAFESKWLSVQSDFHLPWERSHDTMIMSQIINPAAPTHALKALTARLIDPDAVVGQQQLEEAKIRNGWTWGTIPVDFPAYWQYGALDTVITTALFNQHFYKHARPGGSIHEPYELEMNVRRIATQMEINGARVDLDYSKQKYDELMHYSEQMKVWGQNVYGYSLTSNVQMAKLFEELGAEITKRTPSGAPSVDKDQLAVFQHSDSPEVQNLASAILNQRKAEKFASAYFENFIKMNTDGLVHPDIMTLEARTSRMSVRNPALQTLPSGDALVRDAFIPRQEGEVLLSADLDQVEARILAALSEDKDLIQVFKDADATGGDFFTTIMRQVYKDPTLTKSDPRRKLIKANRYASLYGAGISKQADTAGVPVEVMQEVEDSFNASYPGVKKFMKETEKIAQDNMDRTGIPYVETVGGRRLPLDSDRLYAGVNFRVQGSAAEVTKQCLVRIDQNDLTQFLILPIHDEVLLSAPEKDAREILHTVKECMTTTEGWPLALTSDAEIIGDRWGNKYRK